MNQASVVSPHDHPDRDVRQREIVPPSSLASCQALVIGVGAIGRQVALQLAAVGVPVLHMVDHDVVAVENLAPQAYWPADLGQSKVQATAAVCRSINPDMLLHTHCERFRRSSTRTMGCFDAPGCQLSLQMPPPIITSNAAMLDA